MLRKYFQELLELKISSLITQRNAVNFCFSVIHMNESRYSQSSFVAYEHLLQESFVNAAPDLWPHAFQSLQTFIKAVSL